MLTIRLSRTGKRKQPLYRLIVSEKGRDPWGKSTEILGHYNSRVNPPLLNAKVDRITYWLGKGAQTSDTVWNILVDAKIVQGDKRKKLQISKRRKEKLAKKQAT